MKVEVEAEVIEEAKVAEVKEMVVEEVKMKVVNQNKKFLRK